MVGTGEDPMRAPAVDGRPPDSFDDFNAGATPAVMNCISSGAVERAPLLEEDETRGSVGGVERERSPRFPSRFRV